MTQETSKSSSIDLTSLLVTRWPSIVQKAGAGRIGRIGRNHHSHFLRELHGRILATTLVVTNWRLFFALWVTTHLPCLEGRGRL